MQHEAVLELLGYANGNELPVKVVLRDGVEVIGIPTSVDTHVTAYEVFLHPIGGDDTEIGISLAAIVSAELV